VVNRHKSHVQTPVVSCYPAPAPVHDFALLFLPPCGPHMTPLDTGSLELSLLVSPLLGGPARHIPFAPALHLHQRKSSRNLHLQYLTKSQSTPRYQSLITARSDHPPVLGRSGPHARNTKAYTTEESYYKYRVEYVGFSPIGLRNIWWVHECDLVRIRTQKEDPYIRMT
jgi:hypothetical protein